MKPKKGKIRTIYAVIDETEDEYTAITLFSGFMLNGANPKTLYLKLRDAILWHLEINKNCEYEIEGIFQFAENPDVKIYQDLVRKARNVQYEYISREDYPFLDFDFQVILLNPEKLDGLPKPIGVPYYR